MSQSAAQAAAFFTEISPTGRLWTVRDSGGYPAPMNSQGQRAQPFWSSEARVRRIIKRVPAYSGFDPEELDLATWTERWLPGLRQNGLLIGLNWTGARAVGYDFTVPEVIARLEGTRAPSP
ncbi:DUF2750 domain-containing protein [Kribbella capetownensis]|uniref:DUF2750 domain-containing protein n=1 Tax=Kribbella capetownensis TaxID=1572659 RepID=A0A4V2M906_9ACTN|nr:DUF2750 domain-containing protein [Kribbella capetownensis]TCC53502.1 DUF2750 domain-containing protein [Kribbella capetownensis]